jgi:chromosome segregation ATPase
MSLLPATQAPTYEELEMEITENQNKIKHLEEQLDDSEDAYDSLLETNADLEKKVCDLPELHHMRSLGEDLLTFLKDDINLKVPEEKKHIWNYISSSLSQAIQQTKP